MDFREHNFLSLSRFHSELFSTPSHFIIGSHTSVTVWCEGIISFEPVRSVVQPQQKSILLSCGIHGNETAPIEICDALVQDILAEKITISHKVMFIFGNLASMDIEQRFVEENLNRLFDQRDRSNEECENAEQLRAQVLKNCVRSFFTSDEKSPQNHTSTHRFHYDLHTAIRESKNQKFAVYPFLHGEAINKQQLQFLSACDVNTILLSQSPTTTFSYYTSKCYNTHAFTVELGKVKPFGQNDMSQFRAVDKKLRELIADEEVILPAWGECSLEIFEVQQVINKGTEQFELHFADDLPNFTGFNKGQLMASDVDIEYRATQDGEAIVFPNAKVAIGQRALLTVVPCHVE